MQQTREVRYTVIKKTHIEDFVFSFEEIGSIDIDDRNMIKIIITSAISILIYSFEIIS